MVPIIKTTKKGFVSYSNEIMKLAGPLIISQVAIIGISVTDIYMAGQLDSETLAAVQLSISCLLYTSDAADE